MERNNLFQNIVNDENSFTELVCNLISLKIGLFKERFFKFLEIDNPERYECETQYRTEKKQKNGRPDLIIESDDEIYFLENKVNNTGLTGNQPKGYLKELSKLNHQKKHLFFIIPKYYSHVAEINDKLNKFNNLNIHTRIFYWDDFFEKSRKEYFSETEVIYSFFFQLLKEWFGYDHIVLPKKGEIDMNVKEFGKQLLKFEHAVYNIEKLLSSSYKTKPIKGRGEIGFAIYDKKDNPVGWFSIWNELWAAKGDVFVFVPENECDFVKKKFEIDGKSYPYISLDSKILDGNFDEKVFVDYFIKEVINKLVK